MRIFLITILLIALTVMPASAQTFKHSATHILGYSPSQTTVVAPVADTVGVTFPAAAATIEISSSSTSDTAAGIGVRTLLIQGLDANYAEISEGVTMNGTTAAVSVNSYLRINKIRALTFGTGETSIGNITAGLGTAIYAKIMAGNIESQSALYTVPEKKYGAINSWTVSAVGAPVKFELKIKEYGSAFAAVNRLNVDSNTATVIFDYPLTVSPKSDIKITAATTADTAEISASALITFE